MAKRRSSLKGRGSEILFGEPQAVEIEPLEPEPAAAEAETQDPESPEPKSDDDTDTLAEEGPEFDEAELEMALRREALDGQIDPEEEKEIEATDTEPPPTPEMEEAFIKEARMAEEPPEPVAEAPAPTLEVTMEEREASEEMAAHKPPPQKVADVSADVLPPKPARSFMDMGDLGSVAMDIQEPEEKTEQLELPERELTEEEQKKLLARLGSARIQELDQEITETYGQVLSKVGENKDLATAAYNQLLKARDILLRRDASRIPQAEYYIEQVQARLKRATESERAAKKYAWRIFGWGALWGVIYIAILLLLNYEFFREIVVPSGTQNGGTATDVFVQAMLWGGIGGVAAVWYSLFKHVGRRDFDSQYNITYVGKPFLGLILGATVFMVFQLLIRTLGILPAGVQGIEGLDGLSVAPGIIYLMSWACGFKENRIFDLVDRVMKQIFSSEEESATAPPAPPAPPSA